jgi:hypothetical protein
MGTKRRSDIRQEEVHNGIANKKRATEIKREKVNNIVKTLELKNNATKEVLNKFIVRVELSDTEDVNYNTFHKLMKDEKYSKCIPDEVNSNIISRLPDAEYYYQGKESVDEFQSLTEKKVAKIINSTKSLHGLSFSLLITESKHIRSSNLGPCKD